MAKSARNHFFTLAAAALMAALLAPAAAPAAQVQDGAVCTAVVDRACEGTGTEFSSGVGKLLAFTHITGLKYGDTVTHRWIYQGQVMREIQLTVGGPDWRTWSSKNIDPLWAGEWKVEVVEDATGTVLTTLPFTVK